MDKETLRACDTGVFVGTFKTPEEAVWTVSIMPKNLQLLALHNDAMKIYEKVGLAQYFSLLPWGIDIKRAYQVISTLTDEGVAQVEDQEGTLVQVNITEALIAEALKLPRGSLSLLTRNIAEETNATFMLLGAQDYTFKDLLHKEVELALRLFTQHFTHRKAVRYTRPHRRVAACFSEVPNSHQSWSLNFAERIHTELKAYAKRKKPSTALHLNCGLALTRLAYFAVGMIEDLPPPPAMEELLARSQLPVARTVRKKKEAGPSSQRPARTSAPIEEEKEEREQGSEESDQEEASENTETDSEEDPFKEHPAQPEMWDIYDTVRERWTKARQETNPTNPRSPTVPRQREEAEIEQIRSERIRAQEERINLARRHQQRILEQLGKRKVPDEEQQATPTKKTRQEVLEQGQSSWAELRLSPQREEDEELPLQEPTPQVQDPKAYTREAEEPLNIPSPLSVEEVVEMKQIQEQDDRALEEEGARGQETQV